MSASTSLPQIAKAPTALAYDSGTVQPRREPPMRRKLARLLTSGGRRALLLGVVTTLQLL